VLKIGTDHASGRFRSKGERHCVVPARLQTEELFRHNVRGAADGALKEGTLLGEWQLNPSVSGSVCSGPRAINGPAVG
jgi:hypothetical protein